MKTKILIVEDQFIESHALERMLSIAGYLVCTVAQSVPAALKIVESEKPDLVLLDIFLKGKLTGIDLAVILKEKHIPFVYLSANSNRQVLKEAKATEPYGFLVKPFREKDVLVMIDVALYVFHQRQETSIKNSQRKVAAPVIVKDQKTLIGRSKVITELLEQVNIIANTDISVLIMGESGTGKELIAKSIHSSSNRKNKPFIVVNCSALPANLIESELFGHEKGSFTGANEKRVGKFEQAEGGTIFLDEIGELPLDMQVKFLRVLQEKESEPIGGKIKKLNVRIIAATNRNLEEEIAMGRFRLDLFYRLNVFPVTLPPLRDRRTDIPLLANHFLQYYSKENDKNITGFSERALTELVNYSWPGNVRELENLVYRSVILNKGTVIELVGLPQSIAGTPVDKIRTMEENEREHILTVLKKCDWKISGSGGAAEYLNIHVSTLNARIKKLGIKK